MNVAFDVICDKAFQKIKKYRRGLYEWQRVIAALIYRETKTSWGEHSLGIMWAFIEPISHILVLSFLKTALMGSNNPYGISMVLFLASGLFPFFLFRNCFNSVKSSVYGNRSLLVFPQIKILDFAIARSIVELLTYSSAFFIFTLFLAWFDEDFMLLNAIPVINGFLLMWLMGFAFGILVIPVTRKFKIVDEVISVLLRIGYFLSGIMFSINTLPTEFREYILWIPTFHPIEVIRSGFSYQYGEYASLDYVILIIIATSCLGLYLLKRLERYILQ